MELGVLIPGSCDGEERNLNDAVRIATLAFHVSPASDIM
jgi:hypothetical protein